MGADVDKAVGKAKEGVGKLAGDPDLEAEGKEQHAAGRAKEVVDDVADKAKGLVDAARNKVSEHR
ncbi:MAG: CsbD family protein [Candidatus Dormibacteria bacterium]